MSCVQSQVSACKQQRYLPEVPKEVRGGKVTWFGRGRRGQYRVRGLGLSDGRGWLFAYNGPENGVGGAPLAGQTREKYFNIHS